MVAVEQIEEEIEVVEIATEEVVEIVAGDLTIEIEVTLEDQMIDLQIAVKSQTTEIVVEIAEGDLMTEIDLALEGQRIKEGDIAQKNLMVAVQ